MTPGKESSGTIHLGRLLLLLLNKLALDEDLNLLTDDPPAIEHHTECEAKVLAVDLRLRTIANAVAHHGIIEFSVLHHLKRHRSRIALDGQVAGHAVAILPGLFDPGAFEVHRWILVSFQKIR